MDIRAKIIERSGFEEVMSADGNFNASDYNTIKENIQAKQNHHYRQFSASLLKRKLRVSLVLRKQLGLWKIS